METFSRRRLLDLFDQGTRKRTNVLDGSRTRHQTKKCAAQRIWEYMFGLCMEKRDFESVSSLTWFGVVDPCTERCDVEFLFVFIEWKFCLSLIFM